MDLPSTAGFRMSLLLLLLLPLRPQAQLMDFVNIHLTVREKVGAQTRLMPHAGLNISNVGDVVTNENGQYTYTYPVQNQPDPEISVSLLSPEHKLLKPLDGSISVDPGQAELHIEFLVVNLSEESLEFQKRIDELEAGMLKLQREKQLTKQQLQRLNHTLLDTILYFENIRNAMQDRLAEVEQISDGQREKIERQETEIAQLEEKVNALTRELTEALEEKYLRQNQYFKDISASLAGFVRSAKDLEEHLPHIKTYYSANDFRTMDRDVRLYEEFFVKISDRHQEYLEGVDRYWQNKAISEEMEAVFDLLMKGIHLTQIRPTVNGIFDEISKGKPGKAQKMAEEAHQNIALNLRDLEQRINRILNKLRNS